METYEPENIIIKCMDGDLRASRGSLLACPYFAGKFRANPGDHIVLLYEFTKCVVEYLLGYLIHGRNYPVPRDCWEKLILLFKYVGMDFPFNIKLSSTEISKDGITIQGLIHHVGFFNVSDAKNNGGAAAIYIRINNVDYNVTYYATNKFYKCKIKIPDNVYTTPGIIKCKGRPNSGIILDIDYYEFV